MTRRRTTGNPEHDADLPWGATCLLVASVLIGLLISGCGETTETRPATETQAAATTVRETADPPAVDTTAVKTSIQEALQAFWAAGNRYARELYRCDLIEDDKKDVDCGTSRRHRRVLSRALTDGVAAMQAVPAALDQLTDGSGSRCREVVALWADDGEAWIRRMRRQDLTTQQEDYKNPADSPPNAVANVAYQNALARHDPGREDVNRFSVFAACSPDPIKSDQWRAVRSFIDDFHNARYTANVQDALRTLCFANAGGFYYEGTESETTVKTCLARSTRSTPMIVTVRQMVESYQVIRQWPSWGNQTLRCRRAISKVVTVQRAESRRLGRLNRIESSNDASRQEAYDALALVDTDGRFAAQQKLPACLRALVAAS